MINFADFLMTIVTHTEHLEVHAIEGEDHIYIDDFDIDDNELTFPLYQYGIVTIHTYYAHKNSTCVIHLLISHMGEDKNENK